MRNDRGLKLAAFAALYFIWGSTYLAIRIGLESLPPFLLAGTRFLVAGAGLYAWSRLRGAAAPRAVHWRSAAVVGALLMFGGNGLVTYAEQTVPSGIAAVMVGMMPLWMTLLDWRFFGGPRPGPRRWAGLALGVAGVVLLVSPGRADLAALAPSGAALLLLASLLWATGSLASRRLSLPSDLLLSVAMQMLAGGLVLVAAATASSEWPRFDPAAVSLASALAWAYLVVLGSIVALSAYLWLLREVSATSASTYALVNPVVAVALGAAVGGEPLSLRAGLATLLVVTAVALLLGGRTTAAGTAPARHLAGTAVASTRTVAPPAGIAGLQQLPRRVGAVQRRPGHGPGHRPGGHDAFVVEPDL